MQVLSKCSPAELHLRVVKQHTVLNYVLVAFLITFSRREIFEIHPDFGRNHRKMSSVSQIVEQLEHVIENLKFKSTCTFMANLIFGYSNLTLTLSDF